MKGELCVVVPTYGHLDYAALAVESLLHSTPNAWVCLVDDASPNWNTDRKRWLAPLLEKHAARMLVVRYTENRGVTRSWNRGLEEARRHAATFACCTNSDVVFPNGWAAPILEGLRGGEFALLAPVTNAPGTGHSGRQNVTAYASEYRLTDDPSYLDRCSADLRAAHGSTIVPSSVNGFCMLARTETWWKGAFDERHVFNPSRKYRMTQNERELQTRWQALGWRSGIVPASFVFHYRAVTRGPRFRREGWFRRSSAS